jgi:hypothetical protein
MSIHDMEAESAQARLGDDVHTPADDVARIKAEFAARNEAWMSTIVARLAQGPASTMALADVCGCAGRGAFSNFLHAQKKAGRLRVVGYAVGPTGFPNSLWEVGDG